MSAHVHRQLARKLARDKQERHLYANPVGRAMLMRTVEVQLREALIECYVRTDAHPAAEFLAVLAWLLAMGAELALRTEGAESTTTRTQHGALRNVLQLCRTGYRWKPELAPATDAALRQANDLIKQHERIALQFTDGAHRLAHRIRTRTVDGTEVAGAELYAEPEQPQATTTEAHA